MRAPKTTFKPVLAKLPGFQNYLFESNHFLGFVTILHFWRSIYRKYVLVCWQRNWGALKFRLQKTVLFVWKTRVSQLYSKKKIFWSVCRKIVLFTALFQGKRFFSGLQRVTLRFTWFYSKQRFHLIWARVTLFQNHLSEKNLFLCFRNQNTLLMLYILPKKCSCLFANKLGCFEPHVTKSIVFPILC